MTTDEEAAGDEVADTTSELVLIIPTVTVCTRVVVWNWMLVSTAVTVTRIGAVGQILRGVVLFREMVGVADGREEFPVGKNTELVMLSDGLGVTEGIEVFPVGKNTELVTLSDGLGVTDGKLVTLVVLARVTI